VIADMRWLARLGAMAYDLALMINTGVNRVRRRLGLGYWPISQFLKDRVKAAVDFIDGSERSLADEARRVRRGLRPRAQTRVLEPHRSGARRDAGSDDPTSALPRLCDGVLVARLRRAVPGQSPAGPHRLCLHHAARPDRWIAAPPLARAVVLDLSVGECRGV
jgi:hypothetical protein